jgi:hypothetical protein
MRIWTEEEKAHARKWYHNNKSYVSNKRKQLRKNDPMYAIKEVIRCRILEALRKQNLKRTLSFQEMIGCSYLDYKHYIESKFTEGMSWKNRAGSHGWHIDHIVPCATFDLSKESEQKKCFHYTNTQPLFIRENVSKGYRIYKHKPSNELNIALLEISRLKDENYKLKQIILSNLQRCSIEKLLNSNDI